MDFKTRLAYYLFGLFIGGLFLKFVLDYTGGKGVDFTYLPNARVLKNIRNKPFDYSENATKILSEKWISIEDIKFVLTNGDVDFDLSKKPMLGGKLYIVNGETLNHIPVTLKVINKNEKALLLDIIKK
ncbi:MAG: DUF4258 domain-containing protein [Flavobacterium sp.]|nr:DUF4258 domain-containing protein [Flavobacterium sp.]